MNQLKKVIVCVNRRSSPDQPSCAVRGGRKVADALEAELQARGLPVQVERFHCLGRCELGPNLKLAPNGEFHSHVRMEELPSIISAIEDFCRS